MANKSVLFVLLLFSISAAIEGARMIRKNLGSRCLSNSGWWGRKRDYYYNIPTNAIYVSFKSNDHSSGGLNIGNGDGKATLSWTRGNRRAKVHAWVNGSVWGTNRVCWTVYVWVLNRSG